MKLEELLGKIDASIDEKMAPLNAKIGEVENKILDGGTHDSKGTGSWDKSCEQVKNIVRAQVFQDSKAHKALAQDGLSIGNEGDYLVPGEFSAQIFRLADEYGVARRSAFPVPMAQNTKEMPIGLTGVEMEYTGEGEAKQRTKPTFGKQTLVARTAAGIVQLTNDLINDTPVALGEYLSRLMSESVVKREDTSMLMGNGGTINGIANTDGVVSKVAAGPTLADVIGDDLHELVFSLTAPAAAGAKIYTSRQMIGALWNIKDTDGRYIISRPTETKPATFWGHELVESPVFSASPDPEDVVAVFGNLRNCYWGNRAGLSILPSDQASLAVYAQNGDLEDVVSAYQRNLRLIRFEIRHDFKPALASAFGVLKLSAS